MSADGSNAEDSTEYSRYGIRDAPQTAIATPLGQVSSVLTLTCFSRDSSDIYVNVIKCEFTEGQEIVI